MCVWVSGLGRVMPASLCIVFLLIFSSHAQRANVARTAAVQASSTMSGFEAARAVDGSTSSGWHSLAAYAGSIVLDLNESYLVDSIALTWGTWYGVDYTLDISPDSTNWVTMDSRTAASGGVHTIRFSPAAARYVRMKGTVSTKKWVVGEFGMFDQGGGVCTFSLMTAEQKDQVELFARSNGVLVLASQDSKPGEKANGDGTYTYSYRATGLTMGTRFDGYFYTSKAGSQQWFPGPDNNTWSAPIDLGMGGFYTVQEFEVYGVPDGAFRVTIVPEPAGAGTTQPLNYFKADSGRAVSLAATAGTAYRFDQWLSPSGKLTFAVATGATTTATFLGSADDTVIARFACNPVTFATQPERTTVVAGGSRFALQVTVNDCPSAPVSYQWYRNAVAITAETAPSYVVNAAVKADSAFYYCEVTDGAVVLRSDTARVAVIEPPDITREPTDRTTISGGSVIFSFTARGDDLTCQWYRDGLPLAGKTQTELRIDNVTRADSGATFHVIVRNSVGSDTSRTCVLSTGTFINPFYLSVTQPLSHSPLDIRLRVASMTDLSSFSFESNPFVPWADTVWIGYQPFAYPGDVSAPNARRIAVPVSQVRNAPQQRYEQNLTLATPLSQQEKQYYFTYTVLWHFNDGGSFRDTLLPLVQDTVLQVIDTTAPANPLQISGTAVVRSDSVRIVLRNLTALSPGDSAVRVQLSFQSDFSVVQHDTVVRTTLLPAGTDSLILILRDRLFDGESALLYAGCRVYATGARISSPVTTSFRVGRIRPVYTGTLHADSTSRGDQLRVWWNAPETIVDSVRIWWTVLPDTIPLGVWSDLPGGHSFSATVSDTIDTIGGLTSETTVALAIQVCRDGLWSAIAVAARTFATTAAGDTTGVPNALRIDSAWFDASVNMLAVRWRLDRSRVPAGLTVEQGAVWSVNRQQFTGLVPRLWEPVLTDSGVVLVDPGTDILFDTTCTVGLWMRGTDAISGPGRAAGPGDSVIAQLEIPLFTWQRVNYFPDGGPDTVTANNGRIRLVREAGAGSANMDTLRRYDPPASMLEGMVLIGQGVRFSQALPTAAFPLGLRYGVLPPGIRESDLRIYRDSAGIPLLESGQRHADGAVWVTARQLRQPFVILADTSRPRLVFVKERCDTGAVVIPGADVPVVFELQDNIRNVQVTLLHGKGHTGYTGNRQDTLDARRATFEWTIPAADVNKYYGVRALLDVSDGVHRDTINISRRVRGDFSDEIVVAPHQWTPIRATAFLDSAQVPVVLRGLARQDAPWQYDPHQFRLFRFLPDGDSSRWHEYDLQQIDRFSLNPGRLLWLKTREAASLRLGACVSTSLKADAEIILEPQSWTDFCLPFKFDVTLWDIARVTGPVMDSLQLYQWLKGGGEHAVYGAVDCYLPTFPGAQDTLMTMRLRHEPLNDGYTVFNSTARRVALKIPPVPVALSARRAGVLKAEATRETPPWQAVLQWSTTSGENNGRIRVCLDGRGSREIVYSPMPPSLSPAGAALVREDGAGHAAHVIWHSLPRGGRSIPVVLYNNAAGPVSLQLQMTPSAPSATTPHLQCALLDENGKTADANATVTLAPGATALRWFAAGSAEFIDRIGSALGGMRSMLLTTAPNPCLPGRRTAVRFRIAAAGVREVRLGIYDLRGRVVWTYRRSDHPLGGDHTVHIDPSTDLLKVSAGTYLLKMETVDREGTLRTIGQQRLTFLR